MQLSSTEEYLFPIFRLVFELPILEVLVLNILLIELVLCIISKNGSSLTQPNLTGIMLRAKLARRHLCYKMNLKFKISISISRKLSETSENIIVYSRFDSSLNSGATIFGISPGARCQMMEVLF